MYYKKTIYKILFLSLLFIITLFLTSCTKFPVGTTPINIPENSENAFILTPFGQLYLKETVGEDIQCIGKPQNYIRGFYSNSSDDNYKDYNVLLMYYIQKDDFENIKNILTKKIESCGYKKVSEENMNLGFGNFKITKVFSSEYEKEKKDYYEDLNLHVLLEEYAGKKYTIIVLEQEVNSKTEEDNEQNTEEYDENSSWYYDEDLNYKDVTPVGDAKLYDEQFRSIIEKAIGKIHLESYGTAYNHLTYIKYLAEKILDENDVAKVAEELKKAGYNIDVVSLEEPEPTITFFIEEHKKMVSITFRNHYHTLELAVTTLE